MRQLHFRFPKAAAVLAGLLTLGFAGTASAATVAQTGTELTFTAEPGEAQSLSVTRPSPDEIRIQDFNGNPVTAGTGCTQDTPSQVTCSTVGVTRVNFNLGDMDDALFTNSSVVIPLNISGGEGNDCGLTGGNGADTIHGDAGNDCIQGDPGPPTAGGNDQLFGDAGNDFVSGGPADDLVSGGDGDDHVNGGRGADTVNGDADADVLQGGPGNGDPTVPDAGDVISGGSGVDLYEYLQFFAAPDAAVALSLDDQANDGLAGENDNIRSDVEDVANTAFGSRNPNPATMVGSSTINSLIGGDGNDTIDPGSLNDLVNAYGGDDTINSRDGYADRISCGSGNDTVNADTLDVVSEDCETVNRADVGDANEDPPPTVSWVSPAPNATLSTSSPNRLEVTASDAQGISQVQFIDDDRIVCTDTTAPYTCDYTPRGEDVGRNTLVAVAIDTAQQTATAIRTVRVPRFNSQLSSRTRPRRDTTDPFRFTTRGRLSAPGVTNELACRGRVAVQIKAGKKTVSARRVRLRDDCTFRSRVTFTLPRRLKPRRLRVFTRFLGNSVLEPDRAPLRRVRVR